MHHVPRSPSVRLRMVASLAVAMALTAPAGALIQVGQGDIDPHCGVTMSCAPAPVGRVHPIGSPSPPMSGPEPSGPGSCTPSAGGTPGCGSGGAAVQPGGSGGGVSVGGGNPIDLVTGNKYQEETDLPALPGVLGLEVTRHYNSLNPQIGLLGPGWRIGYETVLYDFGSQIQIVQADGRRVMFALGAGRSVVLCSSPQVQDGQVRIEADGHGGRRYVWRWPDGRRLEFAGGSNGGHPLQAITAPGGERLLMRYTAAGELVQVRDPQGRHLDFIYAGRQLQAIETPVGRIDYSHDRQGRLVEASLRGRADAADRAPPARRYFYETALHGVHANALTGIGLRAVDPVTGRVVEQRLSTYAYDAGGLAVLSTKGRPRETAQGAPVAGTGIEQIEVQYLAKALPGKVTVDAAGVAHPTQVGRNVLVNSLGQRTELTTAIIGGSYRLMAVRGPGCSTCGPGNRRYAYDAAGRLVQATELDDLGRPVRSDVWKHDNWGRLVRAGETAHDREGREGAVQWTVRYGYHDVPVAGGQLALGWRPDLVARPSVIDGRERTVRIDYADDGQGPPVRIVETGYGPVDAHGRLDPAGVPIERSTTYGYTTIAGRRLLTQVDGPLPNGPTASPRDSDITRYTWDADGRYLVGIERPMGRSTTIERDDAGRIAAVHQADGAVERPSHDAAGHVVALLREAPGRPARTLRFRHDGLGRVVASEADRVDGDAPSREQWAYDVADRLVDRLGPDGTLSHAVYDSEDRVLRSTVQGAGLAQREDRRYDDAGRLAEVEDGAGTVRRLERDPAGRLLAAIDPLGRRTTYTADDAGITLRQAANTAKPLAVRYRRDATGRASLVDAVSSDGRSTRHVVTQLLHDDFGREVAAVSPDSGTTIRRYDAADRLVQSVDATGRITREVHDAAGRVLERTAAMVDGTQVERSRSVHDGDRLVERSNGEQSERYTYDDHGDAVSRTVTLRMDSDRTLTAVARYRRDAGGRIVAERLPDGAWLLIDRDATGAVVGLRRSRWAWAPFGWGATPIVDQVRAGLAGLHGVRFGNGVVGHWQRSRDGTLARVAYTAPGRANPGALQTAFGRLMAEAHAEGIAAAASASASGVPGALGLVADPHALWDDRLLYDAAGNLVLRAQFADSAVARPGQTGFFYDQQDQLAQAAEFVAPSRARTTPAIAEPPAPPSVWRYHADSLGNRLLAQEARPAGDLGHTRQTVYTGTADAASQRAADTVVDPAGRTLDDGSRRYGWDALGRLARVERGSASARYRYDAQGERVTEQSPSGTVHHLYDEDRQRTADLDANGRVVREYVWLGARLVATIDFDTPAPLVAPPTGPWNVVCDALGRLFGDEAAIHYVHTDHLGAPVAVTDAAAHPVWAAAYTPFGQRREDPVAGTLVRVDTRTPAPTYRLDLRLPGQWADATSGLHANDHREYDPARGRYVSPDPLGLDGGLNPFAYVGNNPTGYVDPLGLILFAFDGTDNSNPPPVNANGTRNDVSNVWKFYQAYDAAQNGRKWYMSGVGTDDVGSGIKTFSGDDVIGATAHARVDYMVSQLDDYMRHTEFRPSVAVELDIVGFSRGAAEARDFSNTVASRIRSNDYGSSGACLDMRFLGLWDTVAQFGLNGSKNSEWQLAIPNEVKNVYQAVALNEQRYEFPGEAIGRGTQRGFIGSHADIGGGYVSGDLSDVALNWIAQDATKSGIKMDSWSAVGHADWGVVTEPLLHRVDSKFGWMSSDRNFCLSINHSVWATDCRPQREAEVGGMNWKETLPFILSKSDVEDGDGKSFVVGSVDPMYQAWLEKHYGLEM